MKNYLIISMLTCLPLLGITDMNTAFRGGGGGFERGGEGFDHEMDDRGADFNRATPRGRKTGKRSIGLIRIETLMKGV